jgi:guanine deaminase
VITPRFIPACTDEMLEGLARLAGEYGCHIQTHCSESDWQHNYVLERHGLNDAQSLDRFGLLTGKTILAHSILVDDDDIGTITRAGSGVAHCPLSNLYLSHAVFPARKMLDHGVKVGLGTDIAGGASPSIMTNCHMAVTASRALEDGTDPQRAETHRGRPGSRIDYREAFWMATAGGAEVLGIDAGQFRKGYSFDAMVVDTGATGSNVYIDEAMDDPEDVLQKIVYNASRQNIAAVWVRGRQVRGQRRAALTERFP